MRSFAQLPYVIRTNRSEYELEAQLNVREAKRLKKDCIFFRNLSVFLFNILLEASFPHLSIQSRLFIFK